MQRIAFNVFSHESEARVLVFGQTRALSTGFDELLLSIAQIGHRASFRF